MRILAATLAAAAFTSGAGATLPAPPQYAFPAADVAAKQRALRPYWPAIVCRGRVPVTMRGGGPGYRFIECRDELDNPPSTVWFRINSSGRVVQTIVPRRM